MWFGIIAILVMLAFLVAVITIFAIDIIIVTVNLAILLLLYYLNIKEIKREPTIYARSAILALIFVITIGQYIPLWKITTLGIFTNIIVAMYKVATNK